MFAYHLHTRDYNDRFFAGRKRRRRRRLQVQRGTDGDPVAPALRRRVRGVRAGRDGHGPDGDGRGPLDTGQGPVRGPVGQRGSDRQRGRRVQRAPGVVPVRRFGRVRRRRRVLRRPVLGVGDQGRPGRCRETGDGGGVGGRRQRRRRQARGGDGGQRRGPPAPRGAPPVQPVPFVAAATAAAVPTHHRPHTGHGFGGKRPTRSADHPLAVRSGQLRTDRP